MNIEISCDNETQEELRKILPSSVNDPNIAYIKRNNLSGDPATWVIIATLAVQALTPLLQFLIDYRSENSIKIVINDIEIEGAGAFTDKQIASIKRLHKELSDLVNEQPNNDA